MEELREDGEYDQYKFYDILKELITYFQTKHQEKSNF